MATKYNKNIGDMEMLDLNRIQSSFWDFFILFYKHLVYMHCISPFAVFSKQLRLYCSWQLLSAEQDCP